MRWAQAWPAAVKPHQSLLLLMFSFDGPLDHGIDETYLCSKRTAKRRFREAVFAAWAGRCAYCGGIADSLDHIRPRHRGGATVMRNLASACRPCNQLKASESWEVWFRRQSFWSAEREADLWLWLNPES